MQLHPLGPQYGGSIQGEGALQDTLFAWSSIRVQLTMVSHGNVKELERKS